MRGGCLGEGTASAHTTAHGTWPPRSLPPRFPGWQSALRLEGLVQARSLKNGPKHPPPLLTPLHPCYRA